MTGSGAIIGDPTWSNLPAPDVCVQVRHAPAPGMALADLRDAVHPQRDDRGVIVDWALALDHPDALALRTAFGHWRSTWVQTWLVGNTTAVGALRAVVRELATDVDHELVAGLLRLLDAVMTGEPVEVPPERLDELDRDTALVRQLLAGDERVGIGIVGDDAPRREGSRREGLVRSWVRPEVETVLTATTLTAVVATPAGDLTVVDIDTSAAVRGVVAVDASTDPVLLVDRQGTRHRVPAAASRPLAWLAPGVLRWHLRTVPIAAVWSSWFAGWDEALAIARRYGRPIEILRTEAEPPNPVR